MMVQILNHLFFLSGLKTIRNCLVIVIAFKSQACTPDTMDLLLYPDLLSNTFYFCPTVSAESGLLQCFGVVLGMVVLLSHLHHWRQTDNQLWQVHVDAHKSDAYGNNMLQMHCSPSAQGKTHSDGSSSEDTCISWTEPQRCWAEQWLAPVIQQTEQSETLSHTFGIINQVKCFAWLNNPIRIVSFFNHAIRVEENSGAVLMVFLLKVNHILPDPALHH